MVKNIGKKMIDLSLQELAIQVQMSPDKAVESVQQYVERIVIDPNIEKFEGTVFQRSILQCTGSARFPRWIYIYCF